MKVYIYEQEFGNVVFSKVKWVKEHKFLGELDLDIKPEKKLAEKVVTKEIPVNENLSLLIDQLREFFPLNARNMRIIYDIKVEG